MRFFSLALWIAGSSIAQAQTIDEGTFSIRAGGREIGREEFVIQQGRAGAATGSTLISRLRVPPMAPGFTQEAVVERRPDGSFANMQVNYQTGRRNGRVLAETARNVLRIHNASGGSEDFREYPVGVNLVGLADSAFVLYAAVADLATGDGSHISGVFPLSGRRVTFTATREGDAQNGTRIVLAGEIAGTIWLDPAGHLVRIAFPATNLEIVRLRR